MKKKKLEKNLISIIIPIYNSDSFLNRCIDSVINQSYKELEIILVDDGSTDYSGIICDNYANVDDRIIVIHQKNSGVSVARNTGLQMSHGKYILFIDSDDCVSNYYVEILLNHIVTDSLVICKSLQVKKICNNYNLKNDFQGDAIVPRLFLKDEFINLYDLGLLNPPWGKLYFRDIIVDNGILFDTKISLGEDLLFNLEYYKYVEKIIYIDLPLYIYTLPEKRNLSRKYYHNFYLAQIKIMNMFQNFFGEYLNNIELNNYLFSFIIGISENEFRNYSVTFLNRYLNARKQLKSKSIKKEIKKIKKGVNPIKYFLLSNNFLITLRLFTNIKCIVRSFYKAK